jgi:hypothetical protein
MLGTGSKGPDMAIERRDEVGLKVSPRLGTILELCVQYCTMSHPSVVTWCDETEKAYVSMVLFSLLIIWWLMPLL